MRRAPRIVFGLLVVATFAAFFVAQRLKNEPTLIQQFDRAPRTFSPNGDGRKERVLINFLVKQRDDVTVEVVGRDGDAVRRLADDVALRAYRAIYLKWDGRDDAGREVPDGTYRARVTLRRAGRSVVVPRSFVKDTAPPRPAIASVGPQRAPTAELVPDPSGRPATVRLRTSGTRKRIRLYKTDGTRVRMVLGPVDLPDAATSWTWDGRIGGRPAPQGTYLAVLEARDVAGNIGTSVPVSGPGRLPRAEYGERLPGRGGITVRRLAVQPPSLPVRAGTRAEVFIDSRLKPWTASLRRVGGPANPIRRYRGTRQRFGFTVPDGASGVLLLSVRSGGRQQRVPIVVQGRERSKVLVVLPWITWQGRNPVDDDGDGLPNLLDRGVGAKLDRVLVRDGLPSGFAEHEALLLRALDQDDRTYAITTDAALSGPRPPALDGYRGVLLPGDTRWLPTAVGRRLRRFVRDGGTLASFGVGSLRREVSLSPRGRLVRPTAPARTDLFGARLGSLVAGPTSLTNVEPDEVGLFEGGDGLFERVGPYEPTEALGAGAERVAAAAADDGTGRVVLSAARVGKGLVVRTGWPGLPRRLGDPADVNAAALLDRIWVLLRSGAPAAGTGTRP